MNLTISAVFGVLMFVFAISKEVVFHHALGFSLAIFIYAFLGLVTFDMTDTWAARMIERIRKSSPPEDMSP